MPHKTASTQDQAEGPMVFALDDEYEPMVISPKLYEFFIANGAEGMDAFLVFTHLLYTAKRQHTNQVWAALEYLKKGLSLGIPRIKAAKSFLREHGIIEYKQDSDETGKRLKTYIRIKYLRNPGEKADPAEETQSKTGGIENHPPANRTTGSRRQMLEEEIEMLEETRKEEERPGSSSSLKSLLEDLEENRGLRIGDNQAMRDIFARLGPLGLATEDYIWFCFNQDRVKKNVAFLVASLRSGDYEAAYTAKMAAREAPKVYTTAEPATPEDELQIGSEEEVIALEHAKLALIKPELLRNIEPTYQPQEEALLAIF